MKGQSVNGGKKVRGKWASGGGGMKKHARSGVAHNHALTIQRSIEENKRLEQEKSLKEKRKGKLFSSVKEAFNTKKSDKE